MRCSEGVCQTKLDELQQGLLVSLKRFESQQESIGLSLFAPPRIKLELRLEGVGSHVA